MIAHSALLFWDVDTQVDFMEPGGKLYVPGAEKVVGNIQRLNGWAKSHGVQVLSSVDAHLLTDPEFKDFPPHCLVGTPGQKKVARTSLPNQLVIPNRTIDLPSDLSLFDQIIVEKQATDVFTNPNLESVVQRIAKGKDVVLYGVVTEICVGQAAHGLIQRGHRVHIVSDAIQHLDSDAAQRTMKDVLQNGGRILTTDEVID